MPGAITDMTGKDIAPESAESLAVNNVKPTANLDGDGNHEAEDGGKSIEAPGGH